MAVLTFGRSANLSSDHWHLLTRGPQQYSTTTLRHSLISSKNATSRPACRAQLCLHWHSHHPQSAKLPPALLAQWRHRRIKRQCVRGADSHNRGEAESGGGCHSAGGRSLPPGVGGGACLIRPGLVQNAFGSADSQETLGFGRLSRTSYFYHASAGCAAGTAVTVCCCCELLRRISAARSATITVAAPVWPPAKKKTPQTP